MSNNPVQEKANEFPDLTNHFFVENSTMLLRQSSVNVLIFTAFEAPQHVRTGPAERRELPRGRRCVRRGRQDVATAAAAAAVRRRAQRPPRLGTDEIQC